MDCRWYKTISGTNKIAATQKGYNSNKRSNCFLPFFFLTTVSLRSSSVSFFNPQNKNLMKILKAERISDKAAVII